MNPVVSAIPGVTRGTRAAAAPRDRGDESGFDLALGAAAAAHAPARTEAPTAPDRRDGAEEHDGEPPAEDRRVEGQGEPRDQQQSGAGESVHAERVPAAAASPAGEASVSRGVDSAGAKAAPAVDATGAAGVGAQNVPATPPAAGPGANPGPAPIVVPAQADLAGAVLDVPVRHAERAVPASEVKADTGEKAAAPPVPGDVPLAVRVLSASSSLRSARADIAAAPANPSGTSGNAAEPSAPGHAAPTPVVVSPFRIKPVPFPDRVPVVLAAPKPEPMVMSLPMRPLPGRIDTTPREPVAIDIILPAGEAAPGVASRTPGEKVPIPRRMPDTDRPAERPADSLVAPRAVGAAPASATTAASGARVPEASAAPVAREAAEPALPPAAPVATGAAPVPAVRGEGTGAGSGQGEGAARRQREPVAAASTAEEGGPASEPTPAGGLPAAKTAGAATLRESTVATATRALEDPRLEPMRRAADQVTLKFEGEGGLEGRLRISVRGDSVRASILSSDAGTLERLGGELGTLKRALNEQGFSTTRVAVHDMRESAAQGASDTRQHARDGEERRQGEPQRRSGQGREPRQGNESQQDRRAPREERRAK